MIKHSDLNWAGFVSLGKRLVGTPYVFGAEVKLSNPDPAQIKGIDCSELVELLYANLHKTDGSRYGLSMPDGSYNQAKVVRRLDFRPNDPTSDVLLLGDLGFKWNPDTEVIHHVGVWIGEGILEAKGKRWGTIISSYEDFTRSSHFAFFGRHKDIVDA